MNNGKKWSNSLKIPSYLTKRQEMRKKWNIKQGETESAKKKGNFESHALVMTLNIMEHVMELKMEYMMFRVGESVLYEWRSQLLGFLWTISMRIHTLIKTVGKEVGNWVMGPWCNECSVLYATDESLNSTLKWIIHYILTNLNLNLKKIFF